MIAAAAMPADLGDAAKLEDGPAASEGDRGAAAIEMAVVIWMLAPARTTARAELLSSAVWQMA